MGILDFLTHHVLKQNQINLPQTSNELTPEQKELLRVQQITSQDMMQFDAMPFHLDCEVKKYTLPEARPYAYIDLDQRNIAVAEAELNKIGVFLLSAHLLTKKVPAGIGIPVKELIYKRTAIGEYTKLICTPYTPTGKISKYPLTLTFNTDLRGSMNTTHGEMLYGQNGTVQKAKVCCWRDSKGYIFHFKTEDGNLVLFKIEASETDGSSVVVYQKNCRKIAH